ncbi:hypothetical protein EIN_389790 [Entamoeba invadens IP1]|uniref:Uncharacterized protein n=1 Tax=Entamoeba invadens IP1 TaxID=370355 RepID=A0A0A1U529_ENTIV|nr:hypothetical protein EIN_389790 [Entamoeba invadens IP1]ELP89394.1 hypothetical protein EIN_389790 [Entamoeba invadens IP1]|eukprot:XP_004256165.1 hypothetical protein EIN_389790 [Entamoeba invadens IP1]
MYDKEKDQADAVCQLQTLLLLNKKDEAMELMNNSNMLLWIQQTPFLGKIIHCAVALNDRKIVEAFLLKLPASAEAKNVIMSTPIYTAIEQGKFEMAQILLNKNVDLTNVNAHGNNIAHALVRYDDPFVEKCITLLRMTKDNLLDQQNLLGETPLHLACLYGNIRNVQLLLDSHVSIIKKTRSGKKAQDYAIEADNSSQIISLLQNCHPHRVSKSGSFTNLLGIKVPKFLKKEECD